MYNKTSQNSFLPSLDSKVDVEALKSLPTWLLASLGVGGFGAALAAAKPRPRVEPEDRQHVNDSVKLQKYSGQKESAVDFAQWANTLKATAQAAKQTATQYGNTLAKVAPGVYERFPEQVANVVTDSAKAVGEKAHDALSDAGGFLASSVAGNNDNRSAWQRPWFLPALLGTTVAGVGLGNYGGRKLFGSIREDARQQEKEDARREYEEALAAFSKDSKEASENSLAEALDRIYGHMSKHASDGAAPITANLGALAGAYLALTGGLGAYGAYKGFKNQRKTDKMRAIEHAARLEQIEDQDDLNPGRIEFV